MHAGWPYHARSGPDSEGLNRWWKNTETVKTRRLYEHLEGLYADGILRVVNMTRIGKGLGVVVQRPVSGIVGVYTGRPHLGVGKGPAEYTLHVGGPGRWQGLEVAGTVGRWSKPYEAALYNHTCRGSTVYGRREMLDGVPVVVFRTVGTLQPGQECSWDYNGGQNGPGRYLMSKRECQEYRRTGRAFVPCSCGYPGSCPRGRGFRI